MTKKNMSSWFGFFLCRFLKINNVLESDAEQVSDVAGDISGSSLDDSLQVTDHVFVSFGLVIDYSHIELYVQLVNLLIYKYEDKVCYW